jgi:hypothetical protein
MTGEVSAYAALGLRPGASRAQVDEAYRRLIKLHHPDRAGGDGGRAAEINRAYTAIRRGQPARVRRTRSVVAAPKPRIRPRRRGSVAWFATVAFAAGTAGLLSRQSHDPQSILQGRTVASAFAIAPEPLQPAAPDIGGFDEPLQPSIIANAIAAAVEFHSTGDVEGAVDFSRGCGSKLAETRNLGWFDACAAFDEASLLIEDQPGMPSSKRFDGVAVVTREMSAARTISDDILAADSRLRRIRSQVEMAIVPTLEAEAVAVEP